MSSSSSLFGWQLIKRLHGDFKADPEVIPAFVHWRLCLVGRLGCVGVGTGQFGGDLSEELPPGWNNDPTTGFNLLYRSNLNSVEKFSLSVVLVDGAAIITLVRVADEKMTSVTVKVGDHVEAGDVKDKVKLAGVIDRELIRPLLGDQAEKEDKGERKATMDDDDEKPKGQQAPQNDPLRIGAPRIPNPGFPNLGHGDLDPLGRGGGGGMLMEPPGRRGGGIRGGMPDFDPVNPDFPDPSGGRRGRGGRGFGDDFGPPGFGNSYM